VEIHANITTVNGELRVMIASYGAAEFRLLHEAVVRAGHVPVAYLISRTMRPGGEADAEILDGIKGVLDDLPTGMDLLLPGGTNGLAELLAAYGPDILLVFGFNWKLPREVLDVPRLGALNVHPAPLPKYRGPSPIPWGIRNGDPYMGLTVHRMTERIDAGPVLAQVADIPIPDDVTPEGAWELQAAAMPGLLATALDRAAAGDPGVPQDEGAVIHAGFPLAEWFTVTWQDSRRDTHNQIRFLRYLKSEGPVVTLNGREVRVSRSSLTDDGGVQVECADGPLWVTFADGDSA
jgi:methionyl-tRNA formyltransferase